MSSETVEYNPFSYEIHEDPYPTYALLRERAPAYYNAEHDFWALSRFEDVWNAFADWQTFSSANGVALEDTLGISPDMIITMDPPVHGVFRQLTSRRFTPRALRTMHDDIENIAVEILDSVATDADAAADDDAAE